jgi:hypothetical protein
MNDAIQTKYSYYVQIFQFCLVFQNSQEVFDKIEKLKSEGLSESDISKRMERETGLSKDLLLFLMKGKGKKK